MPYCLRSINFYLNICNLSSFWHTSSVFEAWNNICFQPCRLHFYQITCTILLQENDVTSLTAWKYWLEANWVAARVLVSALAFMAWWGEMYSYGLFQHLSLLLDQALESCGSCNENCSWVIRARKGCYYTEVKTTMMSRSLTHLNWIPLKGNQPTQTAGFEPPNQNCACRFWITLPSVKKLIFTWFLNITGHTFIMTCDTGVVDHTYSSSISRLRKGYYHKFEKSLSHGRFQTFQGGDSKLLSQTNQP